MVYHIKIILAVIIFILNSYDLAFAQDLILTNKGDSLHCKIVEISDGKIQYSFVSNSHLLNAWIPQNEVKYFCRGFYAKTQIAEPTEEKFNVTVPIHRISFYGGLSRMTAATNPNVPTFLISYLEKLKTGFHFGLDYNYYFGRWIGGGFRGTIFKTQNQLDNISLVYPNGQIRNGILKDDITIGFLGPSVCTRAYSENPGTYYFISNLSVGYLGYKNYATVVDNFTLKSRAFGTVWDLGFDFPTQNNISFGIGISYTIGVLTYIEIDDGSTKTVQKFSSSDYENISRLDISLKLNFYQ